MAEEEPEQADAALQTVKKAFSDYYRIRSEDGSFFVVNGAHLTRIAARKDKEEGDWFVTLYLSDGSSHDIFSDWAETFIKDVFGEDVFELMGKSESGTNE